MKNSECVQEFLKLGSNDEESDLVIKYLDFSTMVKMKSDLLECFVRVRVQEDLAQKWRSPAKGNEKNEEVKRFT